MKVPYLDLKRQYKHIKPEIQTAINRVLDSQFFILGSEGEMFEKEFAKYLHCRFTVGVNSGTDALVLSLLALEVGKGDEVITTPNSFIATASSITDVGAIPIFADIDPKTYQIDVDQIPKLITKKTKAILPVHIYGAPCDITRIVKIAKKYNLSVVEDACQAHGTTLYNKKVGTFGDLGVFSFYPGKNLGAYGDGGAICTNNKKLYEKLIKLRNYGQKKKYYHESMGKNSRLDEVQAAVLRVKLKHLGTWNTKRNILAKVYKINVKNGTFQETIKDGYSNYHLFVIESPERDALHKFLAKRGVITLIHYPVPIHLQECYQNLGYKRGDFKKTERLAKRILSLPMYPELTIKEIEHTAHLINTFHSQNF